MTTVVETSNGWAVVRERDRHVLADGFRTNSAAWRWIDCQDGEPISGAEHVARPARLASCPASRPAGVKDEQDLRDRDAASRWLAKHDKPTAARKTRRRPECGENVTAPRGHDTALR
jgi:hypothetical protein